MFKNWGGAYELRPAYFKNFLQLILPITLTSCTITPRIENVTFNDTRQIIQKIRCEIQDALYERIIAELNREVHGKTTNQIGHFLNKNRNFISELTDDGFPFALTKKEIWRPDFPTNILGPGKLNKAIAPEIAALTGTGIAYRFRFQITEQNRKSGVFDLELPFPNLDFSAGVSAGKNLTRQSERIVTFSETFNSFGALDCNNKRFVTRVGNIVYPIVGRVGMKEVVFTYVGLLSDIIAGGTTRGERTFDALNDRLTFTTAFSAGIDPRIVLNPGGIGQLRITEIDIDFSNSRVDLHEVRFSITPPSIEKTTRKIASQTKGNKAKQKKLPKNADRSIFRDRPRDEATALKATRQLNRELDLVRSRLLLDTIGE